VLSCSALPENKEVTRSEFVLASVTGEGTGIDNAAGKKQRARRPLFFNRFYFHASPKDPVT